MEVYSPGHFSQSNWVSAFAMKPRSEKPLIASVCILGLVALGYGMFGKNDPIFILGVLLIIVGYLLIRKKLKEDIKPKL